MKIPRNCAWQPTIAPRKHFNVGIFVPYNTIQMAKQKQINVKMFLNCFWWWNYFQFCEFVCLCFYVRENFVSRFVDVWCQFSDLPFLSLFDGLGCRLPPILRRFLVWFDVMRDVKMTREPSCPPFLKWKLLRLKFIIDDDVHKRSYMIWFTFDQMRLQ